MAARMVTPARRAFCTNSKLATLSNTATLKIGRKSN
jgi:hypothetical protein